MLSSHFSVSSLFRKRRIRDLAMQVQFLREVARISSSFRPVGDQVSFAILNATPPVWTFGKVTYLKQYNTAADRSQALTGLRLMSVVDL